MEVVDLTKNSVDEQQVNELISKLNQQCDGYDQMVVIESLLNLLALGLHMYISSETDHSSSTLAELLRQDLEAKLLTLKSEGGK